MSGLKVLHCIGALPVGGTETALARLVRAMPEVDSTVVSLSAAGPIGARLARSGVPVVALGKARSAVDPRCLHRLRRLLLRDRPDIVQTWLSEANLYGLVAARLARVRSVVWGLRCADMPWDRFGSMTSLGLRLNGLLSRWPEAIVANSRAGLRYHERQGLQTDRALVIPNGFDVESFRPDDAACRRFRQELTIPRGTPAIGLVGRQDPAKNIGNFLRAAEFVHARRPDAIFVMAGSGFGVDNLRLHRKLCATGFRDRWRLIGERDDIATVMNGLDLLVVSSRSEAFPNVLGEAMACGTPCVSTDVGDAAEILGDPKRTVPRESPGALAAAILEVIGRTDQQRAEIGERDRIRIARRYSLESVAHRYLNLYRRLTGRPEELPCAA